jgi:hypothetical protein
MTNGSDAKTYDLKTCCDNPSCGFELPAPMVVRCGGLARKNAVGGLLQAEARGTDFPFTPQEHLRLWPQLATYTTTRQYRLALCNGADFFGSLAEDGTA